MKLPMKRHEWGIHAKSRQYKNNLEKSIDIIHRAYQIGKCGLSWSSGKDSTVMVHLAKQLYSDIDIIIQFDDCDWPEKKTYAIRLAQQHGWQYHAVEPKHSVWDQFLLSEIGTDEICKKENILTKGFFLEPLREKQKELGIEVVFMGLRAEESFARKMNFLKKGDLYKLKNEEEWHCCPINHWKVKDVFAYLQTNNVEINPCYFHNRFKEPEEIRLAWALPTPQGFSEGIFEHLRMYYPSQFEKLRAKGIQV